MVKETRISAEPRTARGSAASRRLRRDEWMPGVINDTDGKSRLIQIRRHDLEQVLKHYAGQSIMLDVQVGQEQARKALLKEVQRASVTGAPIHADFLEVSMTEKMRVRVPLTLVGDAPGIQEGGILEQLVRELDVECLPTDLVEQIFVDVSGLHLGKSTAVKELNISPNLTVLTPGDIAVAIVTIPREEKEEEAVAAEAQPTEPELIGKKKEEEEGAEEAEPGKEKGKDKGKDKEPAGKGKESDKEKQAGKEPKAKESKGKEPQAPRKTA
ncbi:MAG: 50S ribosomal protein L25 [Verrucomicrobiota bacterium]|nr:50S ribosomal protein L25 [Verrucomicrobiota bacterium]